MSLLFSSHKGEPDSKRDPIMFEMGNLDSVKGILDFDASILSGIAHGNPHLFTDS